MTQMRWNFTLPDLEEKLNGLSEGGLLQISVQDYQRPFGTNNVAAARLRNFAKGHACDASRSNSAILFRKQLGWADDNLSGVKK